MSSKQNYNAAPSTILRSTTLPGADADEVGAETPKNEVRHTV